MLSFQQDGKPECSEKPQHFRGKEGEELGKKHWNLGVFDLFTGQYNTMACSMSILKSLCCPRLVRGSVSFLPWTEPRASAIQSKEGRDLWPGPPYALLRPCPGAIHRYAVLVVSTPSLLVSYWLPRLWHWICIVDFHTATAIWSLPLKCYHPWNC